MRFAIRFLTSVVLLLSTTLFASVPCTLPSGIERLPNGNTLINDAGTTGQPNARVIEVDSFGRLVWAYVKADIQWSHTARRLANGNTLISATEKNRVIEVNSRGDVTWQMTGISYPNEAWRLPNGNTLITDKQGDRVIEVDSGRNIVWSYNGLAGPHNGTRLANGNTTICDSDLDRVIEVDSSGTIVWQYATGLDWARCAQRLPNGNTLITDSQHNRVIEVDSAGIIKWTLSSGLSMPYMATRLGNGHTIVSTGKRVIEVDSAGTLVWQYPLTASAVAVETLRVVNPTSGCSLYVNIHRPTGNGPSAQIPGVVLVPDLSSAGTVFDNGLADSIASDGFAVLHFDADGRGRSSGTENYNGHVSQDGLRACLLELASRPYVDTNRLGIYSRGYGIVMTTGMVARHATPNVKFLMDWEGPSDRYQTSSDSGGHVPVPVDSESFWAEREAGRFIKSVPGAYLRYQSATDHTGRIADNHHAIALIDSATSTAHGGSGISTWTRVNDSVMNPENHIYSQSDPPLWIPEAEERNRICREILYLHELADGEFVSGVSSEPATSRPLVVSVSPNPCRASSVLRFADGSPDRSTMLRVFDASGRIILSQPVSSPSLTLRTSTWRHGVYFLRLDSRNTATTAHLVVD